MTAVSEYTAADSDPGDLSARHESSFADVMERLFRQFEDRFELSYIVSVVRECRQQLRGAPVGALPELTERLAYQRLSSQAAEQDS
jgi:hypothetical protein